MKHGRHALRILSAALSAVWLSTFLPQNNDRQRQQRQNSACGFHVGKAFHKVCNSAKTPPAFYPQSASPKSLICEIPISTAIPLVKPIITVTGMNLIKIPMRKKTHHPQHDARHKRGQQQPAHTIALDNPIHNHDERTAGPPICTREPLNSEIKNPQ